MRLNKKELSTKIGVSQRSLTTWQRDGLPVLEHGRRGQPNIYDLAAVVAWIERTGCGSDLRMNHKPVNIAGLKRELGMDLPAAPAPSRRPREVAFAEQMFKVARSALGVGEFEKIEFAMRLALARVPEELRHIVRLDFEVMDRLTAAINAAVGEVEADQIARGEIVQKEMSDDEADEVGMFWYQVAAGEWHVAQPSESGEL